MKEESSHELLKALLPVVTDDQTYLLKCIEKIKQNQQDIIRNETSRKRVVNFCVILLFEQYCRKDPSNVYKRGYDAMKNTLKNCIKDLYRTIHINAVEWLVQGFQINVQHRVLACSKETSILSDLLVSIVGDSGGSRKLLIKIIESGNISVFENSFIGNSGTQKMLSDMIRSQDPELESILKPTINNCSRSSVGRIFLTALDDSSFSSFIQIVRFGSSEVINAFISLINSKPIIVPETLSQLVYPDTESHIIKVIKILSKQSSFIKECRSTMCFIKGLLRHGGVQLYSAVDSIISDSESDDVVWWILSKIFIEDDGGIQSKFVEFLNRSTIEKIKVSAAALQTLSNNSNQSNETFPSLCEVPVDELASQSNKELTPPTAPSDHTYKSNIIKGKGPAEASHMTRMLAALRERMNERSLVLGSTIEFFSPSQSFEPRRPSTATALMVPRTNFSIINHRDRMKIGLSSREATHCRRRDDRNLMIADKIAMRQTISSRNSYCYRQRLRNINTAKFNEIKQSVEKRRANELREYRAMLDDEVNNIDVERQPPKKIKMKRLNKSQRLRENFQKEKQKKLQNDSTTEHSAVLKLTAKEIESSTQRLSSAHVKPDFEKRSIAHPNYIVGDALAQHYIPRREPKFLKMTSFLERTKKAIEKQQQPPSNLPTQLISKPLSQKRVRQLTDRLSVTVREHENLAIQVEHKLNMTLASVQAERSHIDFNDCKRLISGLSIPLDRDIMVREGAAYTSDQGHHTDYGEPVDARAIVRKLRALKLRRKKNEETIFVPWESIKANGRIERDVPAWVYLDPSWGEHNPPALPHPPFYYMHSGLVCQIKNRTVLVKPLNSLSNTKEMIDRAGAIQLKRVKGMMNPIGWTQSGQQLYFIQKMVKSTLCKWLWNSVNFSIKIYIDIALQLVNTIVQLHSEKTCVTHRNIALRSLLVGSERVDDEHPVSVILSDLGLKFDTSTHSVLRAQTECYALSPALWWPPEVILTLRHAEFERRLYDTFKYPQDVYCLGVTLWEIVSRGKWIPFTTPSKSIPLIGRLTRIAQGVLRLPKPPSCPQDFWESVLAPCLSRNPQDRPTAKEARDAIIRYVQTTPEEILQSHIGIPKTPPIF